MGNVFLALLILISSSSTRFVFAEETASEIEALKKEVQSLTQRLQALEGKPEKPAPKGLTKKGMKGEALSEDKAKPLTPEEKKMMEEIQAQLKLLEEKTKEQNKALENLSGQ